MIYAESPKRTLIIQHVSWGHWFALANIIIATIISSVYLLSSPIADTPISAVYLLLTWLGHTSFITFLGFIIFILPCCYQITHAKTLKSIASVIAAIGLALLAFDALLYNKTGFHISFSSAELLRDETQITIGAFGWLQWFYLILMFVIWLMFQLILANAIYSRLDRLRKYKFSPYLISILVACFISSHAIHIWADARLYTPVLKQDNMFPLSYPATAKTLMARYGLLDLNDRKNKENLLYNSESQRFNYPPRPVYCSVNNTVKTVVLMATEATNKAQFEGLTANNFHLNTLTQADQILAQLMYGIPSNLLERTRSSALTEDLLSAFGVKTHSFVGSNNADLNTFMENVKLSENGLFIGIVEPKVLENIQPEQFGNATNAIIIQRYKEDLHPKLHASFPQNQGISSNEDILPTILYGFGCLAEVSRYSTGQILQNPERTWMVTSKNSNLVLINYPYKTIVSQDGSFEVFDLNDDSKQLVEIDTNLLSRAIKHLKDFSDN